MKKCRKRGSLAILEKVRVDCLSVCEMIASVYRGQTCLSLTVLPFVHWHYHKYFMKEKGEKMSYSKVIENFLRYVKVDTQSDDGGAHDVPSTGKQFDLAKLLYGELVELGASDVRFDEGHCYVYAVLPSNLEQALDAPAIGFIAHIDTSPAVSGKEVKARVIENYGDGGMLGDINYECFNAAAATLTVIGKSVHPGTAKGVMKNAVKLAYEFISALPDECPENTEGYEGFYHVDDIRGNVEKVAAEYIIRDHDKTKFEERKEIFRKTAERLNETFGEGTFRVEMSDTYYNMREPIEKRMEVVDNLVRAMRRAGVEPDISPIRGGTDGARLSFDGLLCPNLCTGGDGFHGRNEYACVEDMEKVVEILLNLVVVPGR